MRNNIKTRDIVLLSAMTAIIEVCKITLSGLANIELTSFLLIMFTLYFGKKTFFTIPVFILIEILIFGFEPMWVIAYVYVWPLLFLGALLISKTKSVFSLALLSGLFGFFFGFFCSFPYLFVTTATNPTAGLSSAIAYWIAGIPYDIIHGVGNFVIMLALFKPVSKVLDRIKIEKMK